SGERGGEVFRLLLGEKAFRGTAPGKALLGALATQIGAAGRANDVAAVVEGVEELPEAEKALAQEMVRSRVGRQPGPARERLGGAAGGKAGAILQEMLKEARQVALDEKRDAADRASAVRTLALAGFDDVRDLFPKLLQLRQPQPVQAAAL